jgi:hypothetical protein
MELVDGKLRGPDISKGQAESLADLADQFWESIPEAERARLPTDLAADHDHYLYGAPKALACGSLPPAVERHVALVIEVRAVGPEPKRTALGVPTIAMFVDEGFIDLPPNEQLRRVEEQARALRVAAYREVDECANCGRTGQQLADGAWRHHPNNATSCLAGAVGSTVFAPRTAIEALGYRPRISYDPQIG